MNIVKKRNTVLIIADRHSPFTKEGYLQHCIDIRKEYKCNKFIDIGDETDNCALSDYEKDPDGLSAGNEYIAALKDMQKWYKAFPKVDVCIGNHSARIFRKSRSAGIPKQMLKSYEEIWKAPKGWNWAESWEIDDVHYTHGTGLSGQGSALKLALQYRQNCVIGHVHSVAGINYSASKKDLVWGMNVGGAIDDSTYAAAYAKDQIKKSIVGAGVVLDGILPIYLPMKL